MKGLRRMRTFTTFIALAVMLGTTHLRAVEEHNARGIVLSVDKAHKSLVVSCEAIPGYMQAMEMPFSVRDQASLAALKLGSTIEFRITEDGKLFYADHIQKSTAKNHEPEPMEAAGLTVLHRAMNPSAATKIIPEGSPVPDFALTDQAGQEIHLAQFQGKVVA